MAIKDANLCGCFGNRDRTLALNCSKLNLQSNTGQSIDHSFVEPNRINTYTEIVIKKYKRAACALFHLLRNKWADDYQRI